MRQFPYLIALAAALMSPAPATAHHSFGAFNVARTETMRGIVERFDWTAPHTMTHIRSLRASDEGVVHELEGMSPDYLGRRGWIRTTLAAGDEIELDYFPRRDGEPGGMLVSVVLADGTRKIMIDVE